MTSGSYTYNLTGSGPLSAYTTNLKFEVTAGPFTDLSLAETAGGPQAVFDAGSNYEAVLTAGTLISSSSAFDAGGSNT